MDALKVLALLAVILSTGYIGFFFGKLSERVRRLERAARSRLPYRQSEGLEDLIAVALDLDSSLTRAEKLLQIARAIRGGSYDPETPAGPRPRKG